MRGIVQKENFKFFFCFFLFLQIFLQNIFVDRLNLLFFFFSSKLSNFFSKQDGFQNVKVADFGLGKLVRPNTVLEKKCGTASYVAPEVLTGGGYSKPADMWSVGVIMHLVLRGKLPFQV